MMRDRAFSGSGSSVSATNLKSRGKMYRVIAWSVSFLGVTISRERKQLATTLARPIS